ncbi:MAG: hypothetical protein LBM13_01985 [Candidatus Ancillula sp.]|jgi:hypothetical protein|nr:hypothetical protein [Candidatus Ancillula sp.]
MVSISRSRKYELQPLSSSETKAVIRRTIEKHDKKIDNKALDELVKSTAGFPFLMQLIGYETWNQAGDKDKIDSEDVEEAIKNSQKHIESSIIELTLQDISGRDREFLVAMAEDNQDSSVSDVDKRMNVDANYAGQYRNRLINYGVISSPKRGYLKFAIPFMKEYIRSKYLFDDFESGV